MIKKIAAVTGAAGAMDRAITLQLARQGCDIAALDR